MALTAEEPKPLTGVAEATQLMAQPTRYEKKALREIRTWKTKRAGFLARTAQKIGAPVGWAGGMVLKTPVIGQAIQMAVQGLLGLLGDGAAWTVRTDAILREYRDNGHGGVKTLADVRELDLQDVDAAIGYLGARYKGLALTEGAALGAGGPLAIAADIPLLVGMNLRAIAEYATYCGFDVRTQNERLYIMNILALAASPTDSAKALALAELGKIAGQVAKKAVWKKLEEHAFVRAMQKIAEQLGIRLTKAKLAQVIPGVAIAVAAGFNANFTHKVCTAANNLYRERFLAEKYGTDIISG